MSPLEESSFRTLSATFQVTMPTIGIKPGIDGTYTHLRAEAIGNLVDEFGATDGGRVHTHLVGSGIEQSLHIGQFVDASTHSEGDIYFLSHSRHHFGKRLATFEAGCDVEEAQLVSSLLAIGFAQCHWVAC